MRLHADFGETVRDMIKKFPGHEVAVAETCYMLITDYCEDHGEICLMLSYGVGISWEGDIALYRWMKKDQQFT